MSRRASAPIRVGMAALLFAGCGTVVPLRQQQGSALSGGTGGLPAGVTTTTAPAAAGADSGSTGTTGSNRTGTTVAAATGAQAGGTDTPGASGPQDGASSTAAGGARPLPPAAPVTIGIVVEQNDSAAAGSLGLSGLNNGDEQAEVTALVADINAHGGLAGHRLVPVYYSYSATQAEGQGTGLEQSACADFTQDNHVFAAIGSWETLDFLFEQCMEAAHVPTVEGLGVVATGDSAQTASLPDNYFPSGLLLDSQARDYVHALAAMGFFHPGGATGVLAADYPAYHRVIANDMEPALSAAHANLKDVEYYSTTSASDQIAQIQGAVLKFRAAGVSQVLTLEPGGGILWFMEQAQSQNYFPRYGLSTTDDPAVLEGLAPSGQLANSVGMGWAPIFDVDMAHEGQPPPEQARCQQLLTKAGQPQTNQNTFSISVTYCEALWFLKAAVDRISGPLSASALRQAVAGLGTSYQSAITLASRVTPGVAGTASEYRPFAYSGSCSCMTYTGAPQPLQG